MALGIFFACAASVCFASGNLLEKWAVDRMPAFSLRDLGGTVHALAFSPWWIAGAVLSVIGLPIQIAAYGRISISVVQSIGVAGVVLLLAAAGGLLKEKFGLRELLGLAMSIVSLALVSLSLTTASDGSGTHGSSFGTLLAAAITLVVIALALSRPALRNDRSGFVYGVIAGLLYGLSGLGAKGLSTLITRHGWIGAVSPALRTPFPYLFLTCWALGLVVFQAGIQRCRVGVVGSLSTVASSAFVVAAGMIVFGEHFPPSLGSRLLRLVGFGGILIGSALVGWTKAEVAAAEPVAIPVKVAP
jgi:hypothetical protein